MACDDCNTCNDLFMCTFKGCDKVGSHKRAARSHLDASHSVDTYGKISPKDTLCDAEAVRQFIELQGRIIQKKPGFAFLARLSWIWGEVTCDYCKAVFYDNADAVAHHHMTASDFADSKCSACGMNFTDPRGLHKCKCFFPRPKCLLGCTLPLVSTVETFERHLEEAHPVERWCIACLRGDYYCAREYGPTQLTVRNGTVAVMVPPRPSARALVPLPQRMGYRPARTAPALTS